MPRFLHILSALIYLPLGLVLYFYPAEGALGLLPAATPLVFVRLGGAVLLAWTLQLLLASLHPSRASSLGLAVSQLLVAATLLPAVLGRNVPASGALLGPTLVFCGVLVVLAVLGLWFLPRPREL
ncbi:hypothetical protein HNR42_001440 [Deinobacterium chartae]|uniref:Uncharacterized protein n=1 Tax=Deinobacterium chartae TaxID=521158 RepID=A0A841HX91_9DEIO|nr:hypothetical protein [Deinobacterium chartae]MBB6098017.1 hypothetical protein [Deinobacterium chartae]